MHIGSEHMIFHQINQLASTTRSNQHYQQTYWHQSRTLRQELDTRDELGFGDEMVLVKMLMEIEPLLMRGSLVMTMAMISPSRREVSPAEQLCRSPRLVPPRFRLVAAESRPERFLMIFSLTKYLIQQKMAPLRNFLRSVFFIYSENDFREVSGLLELCRIGL